MESDREFMRRIAKETREETLKSWEGVLIPGISNEDALRFLRSSGTTQTDKPKRQQKIKKNPVEPAPGL